MKATYLYRKEFSSKEGFRPIMIRINKPNIEGYPLLVSLSSGRYFFPMSIKDLDQVIKQLIELKKIKELK